VYPLCPFRKAGRQSAITSLIPSSSAKQKHGYVGHEVEKFRSYAPSSGQRGRPKFYEREDCKCANVLLGLRASNKGVPEMCDFSLYSLRSRPAQVGDKLVTHDFGTGTRGFAAVDDLNVAVCLMPGTGLLQ
jgi:hypothetical protein